MTARSAAGEARAFDWLLSGRLVPAAEALRAGLVAKVVPADELSAATSELASMLAARPPLAVRAILRAVRGRALDPARGHALEQEGFREVVQSRDAAEGVTALIEKRTGVFKGE